MSNKLIIATSPRTGSNLLVDSLSQHTRARSVREIHNPLGRIEKHLHDYNLCKIFSLHKEEPDFWDILNSGTVVHLYRENKEAQLASLERACRTGWWTDEAQGPTMEMHPVTVASLYDTEKLFGPIASLSISYEYMITNWEQVLIDIQQLIGWKHEQLPMVHQKIRK